MTRRTDRAVRLTHEWLDQISVSDARAEYYDTEAPGLIVRVGTSGSKVFYWLGRLHGRQSRMKLGNYPRMPLAEARREAKRITGEAATGLTPQPRAVIARDEMTLGDLFEWYMRTHAKPHKSTWQADESRYNARLAKWSRRKLSSITTEMVKDEHVSIGNADGPYAANKMLELLGFMYRLGRRELRFTADDPTRGIKRFPRNERERFLEPDELPRFLEAVMRHPKATTRDWILVCLFTGARRSNVCSMRWSDIDMTSCIWTIPAAESKNRKPMRVVLSSVVMEILEERRKHATSIYVFPGGGKTGHLVEPKHAMKRALDAAGIKDIRVHDLRRTLGSWQAAQNTSLSIIGKSLGHSSERATRIYARLQLDPVREAVEKATAAMLAVSKQPEK